MYKLLLIFTKLTVLDPNSQGQSPREISMASGNLEVGGDSIPPSSLPVGAYDMAQVDILKNKSAIFRKFSKGGISELKSTT